MIFSTNKSSVLGGNTIQIILLIHLFFISESKQSRNQLLKGNQLFRPRNGSHYFYDHHLKTFPRIQGPDFINESFGANGKRGQYVENIDENNKNLLEVHMRSVGSQDPMIRGLNPWRIRRNVQSEYYRSEEAIDSKTATDELEIEKGLLVNFKTQFVTQAPLTRFVLKSCGKSKALGKRIVNGADAEDGMYPWAVSILKHGDAWCGGSILNRYWIISASHCFMSLMDSKAYVARVGSVNRNAGTSYKIKKLIMHERFHLDNMFNSDIALLKVDRPIIFGDNVNSVCLPSVPFEEPKTTTMIVVGWGATKSGNADLPVNLKEVTLDRISDGSCSRKYKSKSNTIYKSQICTYTKKKDACQGDSGGPAIEIQNSRAVLIGIVSYGSKCADEYPGVYTQVSYFINWIKTHLEKDQKENKNES